MNKEFNLSIPQEKFKLVQQDKEITDEKLDTKPVSYLRDAFRRFKKNKASIVAATIIGILLIFAILVPIFSRFGVQTYDKVYSKVLPKNNLFASMGIWDGTKKETLHESNYDYFNAMGSEKAAEGFLSGKNPIIKNYKSYVEPVDDRFYYESKVDSYARVGYVYKNLSLEEFNSLIKWQEESKRQLFFPLIDIPADAHESIKDNPNYWYKVKSKGNIHNAVKDPSGNYINNYLKSGSAIGKDELGKDVLRDPDAFYNGTRIAGDDGTYIYAEENQSGVKTRVLYSNYYYCVNGFEAEFLFGTNDGGRDILVNLASGARFSFILALFVSAINMFIGAIYGALEGYYGGATDLIMERVSDILSGVPFIVVTTLFQLHLSQVVGPIPSLLFAFVLTGWIGMAASVRTQFYRFKRQEYVLAARTLGASDKRLIFRHIYPNAIGTLITSSVLVIPSVIFSESTLTYLGIVNLSLSSITSVGTLLSEGQSFLSTFPHIVLFPALFISLLMISFNLFGNGLRDAFNPSLRGMED